MYLGFILYVAPVVQAGRREIIIAKAAQCVLETMPSDTISSGDLFIKTFMMNISSQWDPLNPHDYLMWPVYDGPEAWAASCHFSSALKQCLEPIFEYGVKLQQPMTNEHIHVIVPALFFIKLCEHQSTLTNPITNNAECVHQRILSDDVLRCLGLLSWYKGNPFVIANINYRQNDNKWISDMASSVFECINVKGNWRHSCGSEVEGMMGKLTQSFSRVAKLTVSIFTHFTMLEYNLCDVCKQGSDLTTYVNLNNARYNLLAWLVLRSQSTYLFKQCKEVNYPLDQCHLRLMWRSGVYDMFCHKVKTHIIPVFTPHLPLCDFDDWIRSASRICNMGYDTFMDTASHIARCTKDQDELFPCYKGLYMGLLSWGLVSAGRIWNSGTGPLRYGPRLRTVYERMNNCIPRLYDHLRQTCRYGPPVVQLIQDLRVVLMIHAPAMFSMGPFWQKCHKKYVEEGVKVNRC